MKLQGCPQAEDLAAFYAGMLDESLAIDVGRHLDQCSSCQARLASQQQPDPLTGWLRQPPPDDPYAAEPAGQRVLSAADSIPAEVRALVETRVQQCDGTVENQVGQYRLLGQLGAGGMGTVHRAVHVRLKRPVAVKLLPAERMLNPDAVERFHREMEAIGKLDHPNIVRATDAGEADQVHYLVMELVEGIDLAALVRKLGPLGIADACELIRQAAVGLEYAHRKGLIHRDIKPSNIMLALVDHGGVAVKILDLGLALLAQEADGTPRDLTTTGQMMGTFEYMAPEQGADSHEVDRRADVYALGATLYKLLTGEGPFPAGQFETPLKKLRALVSEPVPSIATRRSDLSEELVSVIDRMVARNPDDRFATTEEVAEALEPFADGADLVSLLEQSDATEQPGGIDQSAVNTDLGQSSPSQNTRPETPALEPTSSEIPAETPSGRSTIRWLAVALALGGFLVLAGVVFYLQTDAGTLVVEIDDPDGLTRVTVEGEAVVITQKDKAGEPIRIRSGQHTLHLQRGDLEFSTKAFRLRRDDQVVVQVKLVAGQLRVLRDGETIGAQLLAAPVQTVSAGPEFALAFDGKDDYVEIPGLTLPKGKPFTVEMSVIPDQTDRHMTLLTDASGGSGFLLQQLGAKWRVRLTDDGVWDRNSADNAVRPGRRTHLACVYDGTSLQLFVNGKLSRVDLQQDEDLGVTTKGLQWRTLKPPFSLGARNGRWSHFEGILDEVRFSSVARYTKDFMPAERFQSDEHTLALFHLDEGAGDVAGDISSNGYHAKIVGAKWVRPRQAISWQTNYAVRITTDEERLLVRDFEFSPGSPLTIEGYITALMSPPYKTKNNSVSVNFLGVGIYRHVSGRWATAFLTDTGKTHSAIGREPVVVGRKTHVAAVWQPGELRLYVDGRLAGKCVAPNPPKVNRLGMIPMRVNPWADPLIAEVDEWRISGVARYSANFTPAERFQPDKDTLALYHFDEGTGEIAQDASGNGRHAKILGAKWVPRPLSQAALVSEPAPIAQLQSWTLETPQHRGQIQACQISLDGTRLLTGGQDATLRIWNTKEQTLTSVLLGHECPVASVQWSDDETQILSSGGNEICLWDAEEGRLLKRLTTGNRILDRNGYTLAAWGLRDSEVVSYSQDGRIRFWNLATGEVDREIETGEAGGHDLHWRFALHRKGKLLALAAGRLPVRIYSAETGELLNTWEHKSDLVSVAISPDGQMLAAGGQGGDLYIWAVDSGRPIFQTPIQTPLRRVTELAFSPDGLRLAVACNRQETVSFWNLQTGKPLSEMTTPHGGVAVADWSADGRLLATVGSGTDTAISFWDGETAQALGSIGGAIRHHIRGLDWSASQRRLMVGFNNRVGGRELRDDSGLAVWDLRQSGNDHAPLQGNSPRFSLDWSPDGRFVVDQQRAVWDMERVAPMTLEIPEGFRRDVPPRRSAWSPDGSLLALGLRRVADDHVTVCLLTMPEGKVARQLGPFPDVGGLDFSPDRKRIAITTGNRTAKIRSTLSIYDVPSGKVLQSNPIEDAEIVGGNLKWSPDGLMIAADGMWVVRLFDAQSGERTGSLPHDVGNAGRVDMLVWIDDRHLAGALYSEVKVWDVTSKEPVIRTLHERPFTAKPFNIALSPDRRYIAAATDSRVSIWDWRGSRQVATIVPTPSASPQPIIISPDGHFQVSDSSSPPLIAVLGTSSGQSWMPLEEFSRRYGWTNDPERVWSALEGDTPEAQRFDHWLPSRR